MDKNELADLLSIPYLKDYIDRVEKCLSVSFLDTQPAVKHPALRLIKSGGKRFRAVLVIASALSCGAVVDESVIAAAAAVELAHLGSLVHDDVLDNAPTRGGQPSIYAKEGTSSAIVVGDYFLAASAKTASSVNAEVGGIVSEAVMKMCEGQMQETVDNFNLDRSIKSYMACIRNKTGALIGASCQAGTAAAGVTAQVSQALGAYGESFGLAFQLIDDLLDFISTATAMGKPVHNDVKEGVYTLPLLISLTGPRGSYLRQQLNQKPFPESAHKALVDTLIDDGSFEAVLTEVRQQNRIAQTALGILNENAVTAGLRSLPEYYLAQALSKQQVLSSGKA